MLRRALWVVIIVFFKKLEDELKLNIFLGIQWIMLSYLMIFRPFESVKENLIEIINDTVFLILCFITVLITLEDLQNEVLRELMIALVFFSGIFTFIIILSSFAFSIAFYFIKKLSKKKKFTNEDFIERSRSWVIVVPEKTLYPTTSEQIDRTERYLHDSHTRIFPIIEENSNEEH
jgi:hypothetical protein